MYLDLLPEEIIQIIWKFIYNDNLEGIPTARRLSGLCCCGGENLWWDNLRLTVGIKKKKGYYYDILKEKYNVTLFDKKKLFVTRPQAIEHFSRKSFPLAYSYEAWDGRWRSTFKMVGHSKQELQEMLRQNNYKLYDGTTEPIDVIYAGTMYKSWTRQRLIKELMSF
tara:strand:- start:4 stop:501 length:498 start_codon:yes stop_codon:yes gene_type:complete